MQAVYHRDGEGREPVNDFIDALAPEVQEEIDYTIELPATMAASSSASSIGDPRTSSCHCTPSRNGRPRSQRGTFASPGSAGAISRPGWMRFNASLRVPPAEMHRIAYHF